MMLLAIFLCTTVAGWIITSGMIRYASRRGVMDIPNARSLHQSPVPRGGGLAIVVVVTLVQAGLLLGYDGAPTYPLLLWHGGALVLAWLGWRDDRRPLSSRLRLVVQAVVATFGVAGLHLGSALPEALPLVGVCLTVVAVIWFVNLYNFMDGADGIAGVQAVGAAVGGALLLTYQGQTVYAYLAAGIGGASLGFLCWNWEPARIFLGDVGSYFLGFQFAGLVLMSVAAGFSPVAWAILFAPFVTDASATLGRRLIAGERWDQAHRGHAYQLLIRGGCRHRRVAAGLAALLLLGLWPLAYLSAVWPESGLTVTLIAYALTGTIWLVIVLRHRDVLKQ